MASRQLSEWKGQFGNDYIARNPSTEESVRRRASAFAQMLRPLVQEQPATILEIGANIGHNLRALQRICSAQLMAVEPNAAARHQLLDGVLPSQCVHDASAERLPFADSSVDLVFTCTVLIHVPDAELARACDEIFRVARRHILLIEYFSPRNETVPYRGHGDMLFKRDYGGIFMDRYPLRLLDYGFFWKRVSDLDDVNFWLLEK